VDRDDLLLWRRTLYRTAKFLAASDRVMGVEIINDDPTREDKVCEEAPQSVPRKCLHLGNRAQIVYLEEVTTWVSINTTHKSRNDGIL
jgi:hypothetical protein